MFQVLMLENDDSFSWNVVDALPVPRADVCVLGPGDHHRAPVLLDHVRVLVIGPGPRDPVRAGLVSVTREAVERGIPTLGICLGYQALGLAFGAGLSCVEPVFGHRSVVSFLPSRLLPGVVGRREVMRYHALALADVRPPLRVIASTEDGVPMAIEHERLPALGVQFHPDSFATEGGRALLAAFFDHALGGPA